MISMISPDLLNVLVCPVCKKPVLPTQNGNGLKCGQCKRLYPIQDDIPIMLIDEAKELSVEEWGAVMKRAGLDVTTGGPSKNG